MDGMLQDETFSGFGHDPFSPGEPCASERVRGRDASRLKDALRRSCPRLPGVYGMLDRRGRLVYVGKSKSLRSRLFSYFSPRNAEEKQGRIIESTGSIVWETHPSEFAALLREQLLIRRWAPRWNVQGIPKRQQPVYLCLGRPPAVYFFLARTPASNVVACEGPFHGAGRMARAVEVLNKFFQLRDCSNRQPMRFAEQMQLFGLDDRPGCLRYEIGTCLGPCVAGCTRADYDRQVRRAQSFLEGFNDEPVVVTRDAMQRAAAAQQYELASRLRDDLGAIDFLHRKLLMLADARRRYSFIYAAPAPEAAHGIWYLIHSGEVVDALSAPTCPDSYRAARPAIHRWRELLRAEAAHDGRFAFTLPIVAGWFRKHRDQLARTLQPTDAGRHYRRLAKAAA